MANDHRETVRKTGFARIIDFSIEHAPSALAAIGATSMGIATYYTAWLSAYSPASWVASALAVALVIPLVYKLIDWLSVSAQMRKSTSKYLESSAAGPFSVNPLRQSFDTERLKISDFHSPLDGEMKRLRTFNKCEICGPGSIVLCGGTTVRGGRLVHCNVVAIRGGECHAIGFTECTFNECVFINLTVFVGRADAEGTLALLSRADGKPVRIFGFNDST